MDFRLLHITVVCQSRAPLLFQNIPERQLPEQNLSDGECPHNLLWEQVLGRKGVKGTFVWSLAMERLRGLDPLCWKSHGCQKVSLTVLKHVGEFLKHMGVGDRLYERGGAEWVLLPYKGRESVSRGEYGQCIRVSILCLQHMLELNTREISDKILHVSSVRHESNFFSANSPLTCLVISLESPFTMSLRLPPLYSASLLKQWN